MCSVLIILLILALDALFIDFVMVLDLLRADVIVCCCHREIFVYCRLCSWAGRFTLKTLLAIHRAFLLVDLWLLLSLLFILLYKRGSSIQVFSFFSQKTKNLNRNSSSGSKLEEGVYLGHSPEGDVEP